MKTRSDKIAEAEAAGLRFPFPEPPASGTMIEVAAGVHWARLPLPMALDHVNIYLIDEGDGWTVIDTGMDTPQGRAAWEGLLAGPLAGKPVTRVVVTHFHPDHVGLAGWLLSRPEAVGASLWMTRVGFLYAKSLQLDRWDEPPEEAVNFYRAAGYGAAELERMKARAKYGFSRVCSPLPVGFRRLIEGDVFTAGGRDWRILIGNGHAADHAVLWCEADGLVLAGDQILPRITSNIGVYPTEPEGDPLGDWLASCAYFAETLPEDAFVLPGHTEPFYGVRTRLAQLVTHHASALHALGTVLESPCRAIDCFEVLYDRKITDQLLGFAIIEAVAHLNYMVATKRAVRVTRGGVHWFEAVPGAA